jgi:hypothetical protein
MKTTSYFTTINLPSFSDDRGVLTVLENKLPFPVVRMYWISEADDQTRGGHRHTYTRQALIAIAGHVDIYMNDGVFNEIIKLDSPAKCLIVEPKDWHTMKFSKGSVLLVLSSHTYDRAEYIDTPYENR